MGILPLIITHLEEPMSCSLFIAEVSMSSARFEEYVLCFFTFFFLVSRSHLEFLLFEYIHTVRLWQCPLKVIHVYLQFWYVLVHFFPKSFFWPETLFLFPYCASNVYWPLSCCQIKSSFLRPPHSVSVLYKLSGESLQMFWKHIHLPYPLWSVICEFYILRAILHFSDSLVKTEELQKWVGKRDGFGWGN